MFDLTGKVAFITGGSKGFGRIFAETLARAGADIAIFARSAQGLAETGNLVRAAGRRVLECGGDVTLRADVEIAVENTIGKFGRIDILINNAGINIRKPTEKFTDEEWFTVLNTNLTGPFYCSRAVVPHMKQRTNGRIINIGSMLGQVALAERVAYASSKAALHSMTKVLALELAPFNITVNAVAPGPFLTDMNAVLQQNPATDQFFMDRTPVKRWGDPRQMGALILYLASDESAYMTGSIVPIDGGWTAQ